jgi:branched-chain amino acid transport system substrate-binding protein
VAAANPDVKLYGPDGVTEEAFANPAEGGIPADVGARTKTTVATLGVEELPNAAPIIERFKKKYNVNSVDPYAIYGYEAMSLGLDAMQRARNALSGDIREARQAVVEALFNTKNRESIIGTYSIDENGDTTLTDYGLYVIEDGIPTFDSKIEAAVE